MNDAEKRSKSNVVFPLILPRAGIRENGKVEACGSSMAVSGLFMKKLCCGTVGLPTPAMGALQLNVCIRLKPFVAVIVLDSSANAVVATLKDSSPVALRLPFAILDVSAVDCGL